MSNLSIHIETTNHCQLKCEFCPHVKMKRPKGIMTDETFEMIVQDLDRMDTHDIYLFLHGEPFLDKKIYSRMARLREKYGPYKPLLIYSNLGVPIDEGEVGKLKGSEVVMSYTDGADPVVRDRNVDILKRAGISMSIHVVTDPLRIERTTAFSIKHGIDFGMYSRYNWTGKIESEMKVVDGYCCRTRTQMCIFWDGRVGLCCMDIDGEVILGDIHETPLSEIWNGPKAVEYRTKKKSELVPCKTCNMQTVEMAWEVKG